MTADLARQLAILILVAAFFLLVGIFAIEMVIETRSEKAKPGRHRTIVVPLTTPALAPVPQLVTRSPLAPLIRPAAPSTEVVHVPRKELRRREVWDTDERQFAWDDFFAGQPTDQAKARPWAGTGVR